MSTLPHESALALPGAAASAVIVRHRQDEFTVTLQSKDFPCDHLEVRSFSGAHLTVVRSASRARRGLAGCVQDARCHRWRGGHAGDAKSMELFDGEAL